MSEQYLFIYFKEHYLKDIFMPTKPTKDETDNTDDKDLKEQSDSEDERSSDLNLASSPGEEVSVAAGIEAVEKAELKVEEAERKTEKAEQKSEETEEISKAREKLESLAKEISSLMPRHRNRPDIKTPEQRISETRLLINQAYEYYLYTFNQEKALASKIAEIEKQETSLFDLSSDLLGENIDLLKEQHKKLQMDLYKASQYYANRVTGYAETIRNWINRKGHWSKEDQEAYSKHFPSVETTPNYAEIVRYFENLFNNTLWKERFLKLNSQIPKLNDLHQLLLKQYTIMIDHYKKWTAGDNSHQKLYNDARETYQKVMDQDITSIIEWLKSYGRWKEDDKIKELQQDTSPQGKSAFLKLVRDRFLEAAAEVKIKAEEVTKRKQEIAQSSSDFQHKVTQESQETLSRFNIPRLPSSDSGSDSGPDVGSNAGSDPGSDAGPNVKSPNTDNRFKPST